MGAPKGNKFAEGLENSGRPPMYDDPQKLLVKIQEYFDTCVPQEIEDEEGNKIIGLPNTATITGLCLYCGFESRQSFYAYEDKKEFSYIIKRARLVIESCYEEGLNYKSPTGAIFALKNMGWYDRQEVTGKNGDDIVPVILFKTFKE